jgi:hypothetical protein
MNGRSGSLPRPPVLPAQILTDMGVAFARSSPRNAAGYIALHGPVPRKPGVSIHGTPARRTKPCFAERHRRAHVPEAALEGVVSCFGVARRGGKL